MYSSAKYIDDRREIAALSGSEARAALADMPFLPQQDNAQFVKLIWYSDKCGGKMIVFKAGSPYLPKLGSRKEGINVTDEEKTQQRLAASLSRTRKRIFEIAACNTWKWFFTGTLDGNKRDREDLDGTFKALSQWIRDERKCSGADIKYLIVPERHKAGGWHFHGLIDGVPTERMHKFSVEEYLPDRIRKTILGGTDVWEWAAYSRKFGYSTMTEVRDPAAVAAYVTKYITKEMVENAADLGHGKHLYYCSRGLLRPATYAEGFPITENSPDCDYYNDWVGVKRIYDKSEMAAIAVRYGLHIEGGENNG